MHIPCLGSYLCVVLKICHLSVTLSRSPLWGTSVGTAIIISNSNNNNGNIRRQCTHTHSHTQRQTHSRAHTHMFIISFMAECPVAFVVHVVTGLYPSHSLCVCVCVGVYVGVPTGVCDAVKSKKAATNQACCPVRLLACVFVFVFVSVFVCRL